MFKIEVCSPLSQDILIRSLPSEEATGVREEDAHALLLFFSFSFYICSVPYQPTIVQATSFRVRSPTHNKTRVLPIQRPARNLKDTRNPCTR